MKNMIKKSQAVLLILVMVIGMFSMIEAKEVKAASTPSVSYRVHRQTYGWENYWKMDGETSGTVGQGKRLESIKIKVSGANLGVAYRTHIQSYGWETNWRTDGQLSGTEGQAKRLEAIQIKLTGADADNWDIYYRVHAQTYGWLGWAKNGESAGTAGQGKRLEAIEIMVVEKGKFAYNTSHKGSLGCAFVDIAKKPSEPADGAVNYMTHVQSYGNQSWVSDGSIAGTSGEGKRLEQISIKLDTSKLTDHHNYEPGDEPVKLGIEYCTHVQTYGWLDWVSDGTPSGTSGEGKRLEAIQIRLTGRDADLYSVYYRVHAQSFGWLGWVGDGATAGTTGYGKRLEAIQIVIIPKMTQSPNNLPADENANGFEKNWPTNKVEMISNMGVDIDDFVSKNRDFWNVGYTDRTTGYTDGALTVSTSYDGYGLDKISWMMLRGNSNSLEWMDGYSNYTLAGLYIAMPESRVEPTLEKNGWTYIGNGEWYKDGMYLTCYIDYAEVYEVIVSYK